MLGAKGDFKIILGSVITKGGLWVFRGRITEGGGTAPALPKSATNFESMVLNKTVFLFWCFLWAG